MIFGNWQRNLLDGKMALWKAWHLLQHAKCSSVKKNGTVVDVLQQPWFMIGFRSYDP